jgi:hypothetical protein
LSPSSYASPSSVTFGLETNRAKGSKALSHNGAGLHSGAGRMDPCSPWRPCDPRYAGRGPEAEDRSCPRHEGRPSAATGAWDGWPRVCAHGLACERSTALPDLVAYGDARRTEPRLRCRRPAEPAPAQRYEAGMPSPQTHRPPLRSSRAAVWAPCEGCGSVAVCRRVEFAPDVQKRQGYTRAKGGF